MQYCFIKFLCITVVILIMSFYKFIYLLLFNNYSLFSFVCQLLLVKKAEASEQVMNCAMCSRNITISVPQAIYNRQRAEGLRISRFKVQVFYNKLEHTSTETFQVSWALIVVFVRRKACTVTTRVSILIFHSLLVELFNSIPHGIIAVVLQTGSLKDVCSL